MKKEYIITGKTVEDAMAKAYATYGSEGDVSCRVLKQPKKGFLGIGGTDAEVAVTVTTDDEGFSLESVLGKTAQPAKTEAPKQAPKKEQKKEQPKQEPKKDAPAEEKKPEPKRDPAPAEMGGQNPAGNRPEGSGKRRKRHRGGRGKHSGDKSAAEKPAAEKPAAEKPKTEPKPEPKHRDEESAHVTEEEMACAISFAETLIRSMELDAKVVRQTAEDGTPLPRINIVGDETGALIGHHGETLDAIQYLINLSANRKGGGDGREFVKIAVDVEDYRAKREETLRALARRMAERCKKYKKNIVLEPMNPYERRIIHSEIQDIPDVSTHSVGYDENRKIVITYEGADKPADAQGSRQGRRRHHRGSGQGGNRPDARPAAAPSEDRPPEYPEDIDYDEAADADYTYEKTVTQAKPEKMSFEDFAAAGTDDIPMGILSEKPTSQE